MVRWLVVGAALVALGLGSAAEAAGTGTKTGAVAGAATGAMVGGPVGAVVGGVGGAVVGHKTIDKGKHCRNAKGQSIKCPAKSDHH